MKYEQMSGGVLMTAEICVYGNNGFMLEHSFAGGGTFSLGGVTYTTPDGVPPVIAVINGKLTSRDDWTVVRTH